MKQRIHRPIFFFFLFSALPPIHFASPINKVFPQQRQPVFTAWKLCICNPFLMASGFLRLPTQLFSPDLRRNDEAISCIHLGMILQNLTLVSTSVQLCVLFSWKTPLSYSSARHAFLLPAALAPAVDWRGIFSFRTVVSSPLLSMSPTLSISHPANLILCSSA